LPEDWAGFAPPPFKPEEALEQLKRTLRGLKLAERGLAYELRGKRVCEISPEDKAINVKLARKLALTPEWDRSSIHSTTELRKWADEVKKRLERWEREE
jgi:hypothetical protein